MEQNNSQINKKDRWYITYKNFLHISYFVAFVTLIEVFVLVGLLKDYNTSFGKVVILILITAIWYYLAQLFKKKDNKAINYSYILLVLFLLRNLVFLEMHTAWISIFITGYLTYIVYRASRSVPVPRADIQ